MNSVNEYNEIALFEKIATGDEQAFAQLFHLYTPKLLPFVTKLTRNDSIAKEMIQETFLRVWLQKETLIGVNQPSAWLYRVASNISITWLRQHENRRRILASVESSNTADSLPALLDSKELSLIIQKAVTHLPERRQQLYRLSREEGLTHQQIADKLNLSPNTVKNQIGISLNFIQEFITKETGLSLVALALLLGR